MNSIYIYGIQFPRTNHIIITTGPETRRATGTLAVDQLEKAQPPYHRTCSQEEVYHQSQTIGRRGRVGPDKDRAYLPEEGVQVLHGNPLRTGTGAGVDHVILKGKLGSKNEYHLQRFRGTSTPALPFLFDLFLRGSSMAYPW